MNLPGRAPVPRVRRPLHYWLVPAAALALMAAAVDIAQWLRAAPLWVDEEMIALNVRDRSFARLAGLLWLGQSAPYGWLVLQRAVLLLVGSSELALRFVPLLFGTGALAAAVWIGQRWMTRAGAALLVLICWIAQWMSHFRFELKHYSADAFWALLLPALAAWVVDSREAPESRDRQRLLIWWCAAAAGQFFSNGALLVTPGCAVLLVVMMLRRHGAAAAARAALAGSIWLAAFGLHYVISLSSTHNNRYLRTYWATAVAPEDAGLTGTIAWLAGRLVPLADNPGASTLGLALWLCALAGLLFAFGARARRLGAMFATVPLSAALLAATGFVPLHERFSLWIVPALYVGVALLFDAGLRRAGKAWRERRPLRLLLAGIAGAAALIITADIFTTGRRNLELTAPPNSNHGLDDRSAVRWLMDRRLPGDALLTTRLGWPAVWWYGGISLARPAPKGLLPDGTGLYELTHHRPGPVCGTIGSLFQTHQRALVYVGFPDMEEGFYELTLHQMGPSARIVEQRVFADRSRVAILERAGGSRPAEAPPALGGCVSFAVARRW